MRYDYLRSFVDSAHSVLKSFIDTEIRTGAITLKDSLSANGFSTTVFLAGGVDGRVVLDLEPHLAMKIAGIMNGIKYASLDHLAIDTICELANIIIGKAVTSLNNRGFKFKTSPPSFFIGEKICYGLESLCISLSMEWGDIRVMAAIKEKSTVYA